MPSPVQSSRLAHRRGPFKCADSRFIGSSGVGRCAIPRRGKRASAFTKRSTEESMGMLCDILSAFPGHAKAAAGYGFYLCVWAGFLHQGAVLAVDEVLTVEHQHG